MEDDGRIEGGSPPLAMGRGYYTIPWKIGNNSRHRCHFGMSRGKKGRSRRGNLWRFPRCKEGQNFMQSGARLSIYTGGAKSCLTFGCGSAFLFEDP